jgi:hypothetical protein
MHNPLMKRYTSIRKAKKEYKKCVGEDFPRWYLYKRQFMCMLLRPDKLPKKWQWLRNSKLKLQFEKSFAMRYLYWREETIDKLHNNGGSLF